MELKIPPLVWLLLTAALMWLAARTDIPALMPPAPFLALLALAAGIVVQAAGIWAFYQARTTANPLRPDHTAAIVEHGIFSRTRNPMYLGMVFQLAAWALWLGHSAAWLGLPLFITCLTLWQIRPEERILTEKFGRPYLDYCRRVRRWL
ncbi:isoprenylcysteine carboxylmethyltransferase family protein [Neisseria sp.]|uniref:methyltransferase family protein n=1 Tax=Neisseria sp. TaxID=192066 RepID=UPI0035A17DE0